MVARVDSWLRRGHRPILVGAPRVPTIPHPGIRTMILTNPQRRDTIMPPSGESPRVTPEASPTRTAPRHPRPSKPPRSRGPDGQGPAQGRSPAAPLRSQRAVWVGVPPGITMRSRRSSTSPARPPRSRPGGAGLGQPRRRVASPGRRPACAGKRPRAPARLPRRRASGPASGARRSELRAGPRRAPRTDAPAHTHARRGGSVLKEPPRRTADIKDVSQRGVWGPGRAHRGRRAPADSSRAPHAVEQLRRPPLGHPGND